MHTKSSSLICNHSDGGYCLRKVGNPALTTSSRAYLPSLRKIRKKSKMLHIKYNDKVNTSINQHD